MNPWKGSRQFLATDRVFTGDAWSIIGENSRRKDREAIFSLFSCNLPSSLISFNSSSLRDVFHETTRHFFKLHRSFLFSCLKV